MYKYITQGILLPIILVAYGIAILPMYTWRQAAKLVMPTSPARNAASQAVCYANKSRSSAALCDATTKWQVF